MFRKASAMTVRQNLGELLNSVQYRHDSVLITKGGKPVAALIEVDLFEKIRRMRTEFNKLSDELAKAYKDVDIKTVETELKQAVKDARKK